MPSIALGPGRPKLQHAPPQPPPPQQQIPISATMATSRQVARASATSLCAATNYWLARAVAAGPSLRRPLVLALFVLVLVLVLTSLGRLERWVTCGGLAMVALSVVSAALQEMKLSKIVPSSYHEFLDPQMDHCSGHMAMLPHLSPVKTCATAKLQQQQQQQRTRPQAKDVVTSTTVNIAPSLASPSSSVPSNGVQEETERRDTSGAMKTVAVKSMTGPPPAPAGSCSRLTDGSNKLDVRHCGTIIDVQGSHGFIIPHDIGVDVRAAAGEPSALSSAVAGCARAGKRPKMPFVIPFNLNEEPPAARQGIAVGKTVEFAYAQVAAVAGTASSALVCARNVTPVCTDDGIRKSRSALQSCKQAREVSFARAMEELTMISLRHVPVKHHVDLIKYAEKLDDQRETRSDPCIF
ncbi:unnamed protein product [Hyaloperonospora brassicae]|uniref:Transmembrane protein n=1 Tax=Hyaloperonospora brassicae TaxID=162125 RepID=A0AAV0V180_HYABA|nr:unnamed protein product [Hyaloperonospora brassicae]